MSLLKIIRIGIDRVHSTNTGLTEDEQTKPTPRSLTGETTPDSPPEQNHKAVPPITPHAGNAFPTNSRSAASANPDKTGNPHPPRNRLVDYCRAESGEAECGVRPREGDVAWRLLDIQNDECKSETVVCPVLSIQSGFKSAPRPSESAASMQPWWTPRSPATGIERLGWGWPSPEAYRQQRRCIESCQPSLAPNLISADRWGWELFRWRRSENLQNASSRKSAHWRI